MAKEKMDNKLLDLIVHKQVILVTSETVAELMNPFTDSVAILN